MGTPTDNITSLVGTAGALYIADRVISRTSPKRRRTKVAKAHWITYRQLSYTNQKLVQKRYKPPYSGWLYRVSYGEVTSRRKDK